MYLPEDFHSKNSVSEILAILETSLEDPSVLNGKMIDAPLLLFGLTFRELSRAMEHEDGNMVPSYLANSCLGVKQYDRLNDILTAIRVP
jgi:hypothetical protein